MNDYQKQKRIETIKTLTNEERYVKRKYNVVFYFKGSSDYVDYDIIFTGDKTKLVGAIKASNSLDTDDSGLVCVKYEEVTAFEIRGGEPYEEE